MPFPPEILPWITVIVLMGTGVVLTTILKHFTQKHLNKSDNMLIKIENIERENAQMNLHMSLLNLPETKRKAETAYRIVNVVEGLESIFKKHEEDRKIDRELIIKLTGRVENTQTQLELITKNNEEHFALVENAFTAKVAEVVQMHLSQFREDNRKEFVAVNHKLDISNDRYYALERRVSELESTHRNCVINKKS